MSDKPDLKSRVDLFNFMQLPGQPMGMHMGTLYLVNDLWREIERLRRALTDARDALHNDFEPGNQSNAYRRADKALSSTESQT